MTEHKKVQNGKFWNIFQETNSLKPQEFYFRNLCI